jgi:hypothetical protein
MELKIKKSDYTMLCKMVERGWADGDLAEYLNADQIVACERILKALDVSSSSPRGTTPPSRPDYSKVLKVLTDLLEQAEECEASTGTTPTAQEALNWAIGEVEGMAAGRTADTERSEGPR